MSINYKPQDGWAADFIPFYWNGEYHLFYLKDFRDISGHGEGTPWYHLVTPDLVHFTDHGECLARGALVDQDLYVFTGSCLYAEGRFHIFYTGHNPYLRQAGKPEQAILHAVSNDLYHWQKSPAEVLFAPADRFELHDWRDPYVFWNPEAGEYWMLVAARLTNGPSRRRGCTGLCTSKDLLTWEVREPLYAPGLYYTHECPDLFRIGEWWYLLFSEFSESSQTRYRMSHSPYGPWITPAVDTFDGRAFYAAKTTSNGLDRILFGWNPTRLGDKDQGDWQWGGNLVAHELIQQNGGSLAVRIPAAVSRSFAAPLPFQFTHALNTTLPEGNASARLDCPGSFGSLSAGKLPETCKIELSAAYTQPTHSFGIMLRIGSLSDSGYFIRFEPLFSRLVFDSWPRRGDRPHWVEVERPLNLQPGVPLSITIYTAGSLCEVYVDSRVAMSTRMYDHPNGDWGIFVSEGCVDFGNITLSAPS
jgi:beta-fructofuranosidase